MQSHHETDLLKAELAKMARNGSPEELKFRSELDSYKNKSAPLVLAKGNADLEKRWKKAQSGNLNILFIIIILSVAGYPLQIVVELVVGSMGVSSIFVFGLVLSVIVYSFVRHNQNHRKTYIDLQVSKGMSEMDAFRDYQKKFNGS
jgi:Flp pilus assembly protein TadB